MKLFDSHCHLDDAAYAEDLPEVLARARQQGVARIMLAGTNRQTSGRAVALAEAHEGLYAAVGIHPHDAAQGGPEDLAQLAALARNAKVRAWGETGLDFNRMHSPAADQERLFIAQMERAVAAGLPLIFHERDSGGRFLRLLERHLPPGWPGVVHCFSGGDAELEGYLARGLLIGITGIVTIRSRGAELRRQVRRIPPERLLIETDAPWLVPAPEKNRTRRNEPAFVQRVLQALAAALECEAGALAGTLWCNTCRFFRLPE
jgi:TatD DNase family protein